MMSEGTNTYADRAFYQKSGGKSYLVICSGEEPELPYQINMIKYNNIDGLLPVQFFIEDGEYRYFYDISCKESLAERMKQRKYSVKEIRTVMSDLYRCVQQMEEYLLDMDCLILEPEYLFTEKNNFKIQFCFYQDKKETFEKSLENLFDYFLNRLDYQDEKTVVLVYSLYQKSREKNIPLYELMKQFCELPSSENKQKKSGELFEDVYEKDEEEYDDRYQERVCKKIEYQKNAGRKQNISGKCSKEKQKENILFSLKLDNVFRLISYAPDVAGGLGIASILWYISKNHAQMSGRTFMFWMFGVAGILVGCGILSTVLSGFVEKKSGTKEERESDERREDKAGIKRQLKTQPKKNNLGQWYNEHKGEVNREKSYMTNCSEKNDAVKLKKQFDDGYGEQVQNTPNEARDADLFEEFSFEDVEEKMNKINTSTGAIPATIVMGEPELFQIFNPVLVSKNKNEFQDIVIKEHTMVVGKVRGIADICLEGKSISRIHARISRDQNGCSVTDLGSTNGTYINGMRLSERQMRYLKQGDEVRFAEAVFEFKSEESENLRSQQLSEVI